MAYRALSQRGQWTPSLQKRLEEHAERTWDLSPEVWHLLALPCPFLEKAQCMIYAARPFMCRTMLSSGNPEDCHPHRVSQGMNLLPRREALETFFAKQSRLLQRHRLSLVMMPFSKAVLLGARVGTGEVDLENYLTVLAEEYTR